MYECLMQDDLFFIYFIYLFFNIFFISKTCFYFIICLNIYLI